MKYSPCSRLFLHRQTADLHAHSFLDPQRWYELLTSPVMQVSDADDGRQGRDR